MAKDSINPKRLADEVCAVAPTLVTATLNPAEDAERTMVLSSALASA